MRRLAWSTTVGGRCGGFEPKRAGSPAAFARRQAYLGGCVPVPFPLHLLPRAPSADRGRNPRHNRRRPPGARNARSPGAGPLGVEAACRTALCGAGVHGLRALACRGRTTLRHRRGCHDRRAGGARSRLPAADTRRGRTRPHRERARPGGRAPSVRGRNQPAQEHPNAGARVRRACEDPGRCPAAGAGRRSRQRDVRFSGARGAATRCRARARRKRSLPRLRLGRDSGGALRERDGRGSASRWPRGSVSRPSRQPPAELRSS